MFSFKKKLAKFWVLKLAANILVKNKNHVDLASHRAGYEQMFCLPVLSCYFDKSQGNFSLAISGVNASSTKFHIRCYGL